MTTLSVINPDGSAGTATDQHQELLKQAQAVIEADSNFKALTGPTLSRAEVNAGVPATDHGYLYIRYDVPGATPQEFWAHQGSHDKLSWKSGQVSVKAASTPT